MDSDRDPDPFPFLDTRLTVSSAVADLLMMDILTSAMDQAHAYVHSEPGHLACLNGRSRFCELALAQLEWCLRFLHQEVDCYIAESGREREKLVGELVKTRDCMQRRMEGIERAIEEKDGELLELRREVEVRDRIVEELSGLLEVERKERRAEREIGIAGGFEGMEIDRIGVGFNGGMEDKFKKGFVEMGTGCLEFDDSGGKEEEINEITVHIGTERDLEFKFEKALLGKVLDSVEFDVSVENEEFEEDVRTSVGSEDKMRDDFDEATCGKVTNGREFDVSAEKDGEMNKIGVEIGFEGETEDKLEKKFLGKVKDKEAGNGIKFEGKMEDLFDAKDRGVCCVNDELEDNVWSSELEKEVFSIVLSDFLKNAHHDSAILRLDSPDSAGVYCVNTELEESLWCKNLEKELHSIVLGDFLKNAHDDFSILCLDFRDAAGVRYMSAELEESLWCIELQKEILSTVVGSFLKNGHAVAVTLADSIRIGCVNAELEEKLWRKELEKEVLRIVVGSFLRNAHHDFATLRIGLVDLTGVCCLNYKWGENLWTSEIEKEVLRIVFVSYLKYDHANSAILCRNGSDSTEICHVIDELEVSLWSRELEKEVLSIVFGSFLKNADVSASFRLDLSDSKWSMFVNDMTCLRDKLKGLASEIDRQMENVYDDFCDAGSRRILSSHSNSSDALDASKASSEFAEAINFSNSSLCVVRSFNFIAESARSDEPVVGKRIEEMTPEKGQTLVDNRKLTGEHGFGLGLIKKNIRGVVTRLDAIVKETKAQLADVGGFRRSDEVVRLLNHDEQKLEHSDPKATDFEHIISDCSKKFAHNKKLECCEQAIINAGLKNEICCIVYSETIKEWRNAGQTFVIECMIKEEMDELIFRETTKDIKNKFWLEKMRLSSNYANQKEDSLPVDLLELEKDSPVSVDSMLTDLLANNNIADWDSMYLEDSMNIQKLMEDNDDAFVLVQTKLEKSLEQIEMSKAQLKELGISLGISFDGKSATRDQPTPAAYTMQEENCSTSSSTKTEHRCSNELLLMPLETFPHAVADFETYVCARIQESTSRLEELRSRLNPISGQVDTIMKDKLLYQKAFMRRCYNLQTAEIEVDLLGDEVDALLALLERVYTGLRKYMPVFQHHSGLMEILSLIHKELGKE